MNWLWDASHFPHRVTPAFADLYCEPAERGVAAGAARYGLALRGWQVRVDRGRVVTRNLDGLSPNEVAAREARAVETLHTRRWIADADTWRKHGRRNAIIAASQLGRADLGSLSASALAHHLHRTATLVASGVARHFELHMADMLPLGLLLVAASAKGIGTDEVLSSTTSGAPLLPRTMAAWNVVGRLDVDAPTLGELTLAHDPPLSRGPAVHAASFDDPVLDALVDDVQRTFWIRDDNATLLLSGPVGLVRLALLEAGRRLGVDTFAITAPNVIRLLNGTEPATSEFFERDDDQPEGEPGPTSVRLGEALDAYDVLYEAGRPFGVGDHVVKGRAVVAETPDEAFHRLTSETVLVVRTTAPAFDPALATVGAVVTELGGPLCHAAIAARELGLAAVVGLAGATSWIPDGALVEVDPAHTTVVVLAE